MIAIFAFRKQLSVISWLDQHIATHVERRLGDHDRNASRLTVSLKPG
jgi:hypothetical protein